MRRPSYRSSMQIPPEVVIHLAARAGVQPSIKEPLLYERVNVRGTIVLLEACRRFGVRKFVFASSSSVYGTSNSVPFREEDCLESPISPYGATKIAAEKMCFTYSHLYHLQVTCLRLFTVYGPRQRPDLAIRKFIEKIDDGHPITVFGDGRTARDLTFIDDTVDGILAALAYDSSWDVFNLGNARPVSLNSLIATIEECLGKKAKIQRLPSQPGDMLITHGDISKAHRLLGYSPATLLTDGLYRTIAWCRSVDKSAKV